MQPTADKYFVRVDSLRAPRSAPARARQPVQLSLFDDPAPRRRRRKHDSNQRRFAILVLGAAAVWTFWASEQPGGVSGTVDRFVQRVRDEVESASGGPGLDHATTYFNDQYRAAGVYPTANADQMVSAGLDLGVDVVNCGSQGLVLRTVTVSRLLVAGQNRGDVPGSQGCPDDLTNPSPWKSQ